MAALAMPAIVTAAAAVLAVTAAAVLGAAALLCWCWMLLTSGQQQRKQTDVHDLLVNYQSDMFDYVLFMWNQWLAMLCFLVSRAAFPCIVCPSAGA
jgi:hypothetical protein